MDSVLMRHIDIHRCEVNSEIPADTRRYPNEQWRPSIRNNMLL
ncbi:unnamed protein product [Acanthoscelides obtectus]|uniref:Uncharacterized protein n=1 Tax=Acanthoscelides obtectus TaxID=200917 RepID=A0A9P0JPY3_ACAOB|nr:unnamed protein product [Acanthoscelides obtectus]CAK1621182.1 hypothetical protein AOBTE_LOCUS818 [Acanthoscelides obtectus]